MNVAFHKKNTKQYCQYTIRIEECILDTLKDIAKAEDISVNECINQSLQIVIDEYNKNSKSKDTKK